MKNESDPGPKKAFSILVIEDDQVLCDLVSKKMDENGFSVSCIQDGEAAIEYLQKHKPHVVLLDLKIPKKDGFEVLAWIKDHIPQLPVLVFSNLNRPQDIEQALSLGAREYLLKVNYTPQEVIDRIFKVIHQTYF